MALPSPATGEIVEATDVTGIKAHLEGASGSTAPWHFRQSSGNFKITLSTNDGTTKVSLVDSDGTEVFAVDSDGNLTLSGSISTGTFIYPLSATPSQTTEGQGVWDTDDDVLTVGDGSSRRRFDPDNKGSDIASASTLTLGNDHYYHVTGTTTITGLSTKPSGYVVFLEFDEPLTLTHNSTSFILTGGVSRTLQAHETAMFISEGSGNWREFSSGRGNLAALVRGFVSDGAYQGFFWVGIGSGDDVTDNGAPVGLGGKAYLDTGCKLSYDKLTGLATAVTSTTSTHNAGVLGASIPANRDFQVGAHVRPSSVASQSVVVGATSNPGFNDTTNDAIAFRVNGTGNIIGYCDSGGTETTRDTGVTPDGSTVHRLVVVRAAGVVQFYRNGVQVGANVTTNIPATTLDAKLGIRTSTSASKSVYFQDFSGVVAAS